MNDTGNPIVKKFIDSTPEVMSNAKKKSKLLPILLVLFVIFVLLGLASYKMVYLPGMALLANVKVLEATAKAAVPYAKTQDLAGIKQQLEKTKIELSNVQAKIKGFSWAQGLPVAKNYYSDGNEAVLAGFDLISATEIGIDAIAPYADIIGLKGLASTVDGGKTAQDRINIIVETLDKIRPQLDNINVKISSAQKHATTIDPSRYPENFKRTPVRAQLIQGLDLMSKASQAINEAKPLLDAAPYVLGIKDQRRYLVLFQNDAELRPTGGFLTGYAIINVNKGKVQAVESDDIYKLDEKFTKRIPAPAAILKYLPLVPYWYLRDQNLSPDFRVSMETFMPNYALTKSPVVDGVIAVDTKVLVELLKVTGPIGVPAYGNFSADNDQRCNCPNVFYELQILAGGEESVVWDSVTGKIIKAPANYGNRKAFLGPMMYSILANVMAQPKSRFPTLFNTALSLIQGKHVQAYMFDPKAQLAVESFNMGGRTREFEGDYLQVIDTNFAGAKTNIWVTYKADQQIDIDKSGNVVKTLTLTYSNPQQKSVKITQARNLNGAFRDWHRVYLPKGTEVLEVKGYENKETVSEDLGKTVVDGFFTLTPGNTKQISLKYKIPAKAGTTLKMLIQKQGGSNNFPYTTTINGKFKGEEILDGDKELSLSY